jgi:hypothetical protein
LAELGSLNKPVPELIKSWPGTDVTILKIFSQKKLAKRLSFLHNQLLVFEKKMIVTLVFEKNADSSAPELGCLVTETFFCFFRKRASLVRDWKIQDRVLF